MPNARGIEQLKDLGAGKAAPGEVVRLYRRAFDEVGPRALWSRKPSEHPTITQALVIANALRAEGNLEARAMAVRIEDACRAAL